MLLVYTKTVVSLYYITEPKLVKPNNKPVHLLINLSSAILDSDKLLHRQDKTWVYYLRQV